MIKKRPFLLPILVAIVSLSFMPSGNLDCKNFHLKNSFSIGDPYQYSMQSNDVKMVKGKPVEFNILVFSGYEYNIAAGFDLNSKAGRIRIVDAKNEQVLYDSKKDKTHRTAKQFIVKQTKNLRIILSDDGIDKNESDLPEFYCAGLLIEYLQLPEINFN